MINSRRAKWLKILIGIFSIWISFIISMAILLLIVWVFQTASKIEFVDAPAIIILIIGLIISSLFALRIYKWQNNFFDAKPIKYSYLFLAILILLSILFIPAPMIYSMII